MHLEAKNIVDIINNYLEKNSFSEFTKDAKSKLGILLGLMALTSQVMREL